MHGQNHIKFVEYLLLVHSNIGCTNASQCYVTRTLPLLLSCSSSPIPGFLDDYAFLIRGLLDLYEACFDPYWLEWAEVLQDQQDRLFWDDDGAGYFTSPAGDTSILIRLKEGEYVMLRYVQCMCG